ncbi:hypothetical protein BJV74DRAFT_952025 [Russula compacta]|nr:hypothetical protein BJV74DRAFT_952025 [Russula compacta]
MAIYIPFGGLPSLSEAYPAPVLLNVSNKYSMYDHVNTAPSLHLKEHPAKRAKADQARVGNNVGLPAKRFRGRLSELPTMPLDILYEIFGHLHPSDLLSLSRVNKAFRSVLMSRNSSFLWNACFKLCGAPTSPVDMSPPAWAHLLFGSAHCYNCGAKPVTRILFSLRRRACKSCIATHLRCSSQVPQEFRDMICFDSGNSRGTIHTTRSSCIRHWWNEDVTAFFAELDAIKSSACGPDGVFGDTETIVSEFLARKQKHVADITEHALFCAAWERDRNAGRTTELSDVRLKRFEDIKARFLQLGYLEEDVNQLRRHREVRTSKPMSDRVWQRVEPLLRPGVNRARDERLIREGGDSYHRRRRVVLEGYANFSRTLSPLLLALAPTVTEFLCEDQGLADALALGSDPNYLSLRARIFEAISRLRPDLETRKRERTRLLRSLLPKLDVPERATDDEAVSLATSVYECSDCRLPTSGFHMLAHDCDRAPKPHTLHPLLSEPGRETVEMLLQLLGLGKETTALELDRRNDRFVCMRCTRGSFPQNGQEVLGRCARDWRSCVAHAIGSRNERWHKNSPKWQLVGAAEMIELRWDELSTSHAYGCLHCPTRVDISRGSIQWYTKLSSVREHIQKDHGKNEPLEGEDFFFDYKTRRSGCRSLLAMSQ